jgi:hypothetical protein
MNVKHLEPLRLGDSEWAICYQDRDYNTANQVIKYIGDASKSLGINFGGDPLYIEIPRNEDLMKDGANA